MSAAHEIADLTALLSVIADIQCGQILPHIPRFLSHIPRFLPPPIPCPSSSPRGAQPSSSPWRGNGAAARRPPQTPRMPLRWLRSSCRLHRPAASASLPAPTGPPGGAASPAGPPLSASCIIVVAGCAFSAAALSAPPCRPALPTRPSSGLTPPAPRRRPGAARGPAAAQGAGRGAAASASLPAWLSLPAKVRPPAPPPHPARAPSAPRASPFSSAPSPTPARGPRSRRPPPTPRARRARLLPRARPPFRPR